MSAKCLLSSCPWSTDEPLEDIAGPLATWHVYEEHPEIWRRHFGGMPPSDPDVRDPFIRNIILALNGVNLWRVSE